MRWRHGKYARKRTVRVRTLAGEIVLCSWERHCTITMPLSSQVYKWVTANLKGLGHAILGNFSTDQMVIELIKYENNSSRHRRTQTKHRKATKGHEWTKLERTEMDCIWVNWEKRRPTFYQIYVSLYQNIIYTAGKSFSVVMWPWFCKWKTLALPIWRLELIIDKIKQNYLK